VKSVAYFFFSILRGFVRVFQIDTKVAVNPGVAMDAKTKALVRDLIEYAVAELDNIFLKGFVAGWVIQHFSDDSGVPGPQDIVFGDSYQISNAKTSHNRIV
jgi:hypothetical protein